MKILLILVLLVIIWLEIYFLTFNKNVAGQADQKANKIIDYCKTQNIYKNSCYDSEIPKLLDKLSGKNVFEVVRIIQEKDADYAYCHVVGHEIAARLTAKDPSKWREVLAQCTLGICSNGCQHGVLQEKFRNESFSETEITQIIPDLSSVCEPSDLIQLSGFEISHCYHGLGHLLMYMTEGDTKKASSLCKEIALKDDNRDYLDVCYEGVFMQLFQPLEPEDFSLVDGKAPQKNSLRKYCESFKDPRTTESCWIEGWPLYSSEIKNPKGLVGYCETSKDTDQKERCYKMLFAVISQSQNFDINSISVYCEGFNETLKYKCYSGAATAIIQATYQNGPKAVNLCSLAKNVKDQDKCFDELLKYANYNLSSDKESYKLLCSSFVDPWKSKCLSEN